MSTLAKPRVASSEATGASDGEIPSWSARRVRFADDRMYVVLRDGREIEVSLDDFPRLANASPAQRKRWRLIARGRGLHWPALDEDISVAILLGQDD